jgi:peptidoglycan/LPS O-acetylase OafA/YrhL
VKRRGFGYNPQLDGLRALAVALVIGGHVSYSHLLGAWTGVEIFFVLSGFLITTLLVQEYRAADRIDLVAFYGRRARRLLPALVVCLGCCAVLIGFAAHAARVGIGWAALGAVFYANNWLVAEHVVPMSLLLHTWSLAQEEQFYLVWPAVLWFALRRGVGIRRLCTAAAASTVAFAIWRPVLVVLYGTGPRSVYGSDARACGLALGCALALAYEAGWGDPIARLVATSWLPLAGLLVIAVTWVGVTDQTPYSISLGMTLVDLAAAVLIAHVLARPGRPFGQLLGAPALVWAGRRSYGMYLFHFPVALVLLAHGVSPAVAVAGTIVCTVLLAAASYTLVEQPIRQGGKRLPLAALEGVPA